MPTRSRTPIAALTGVVAVVLVVGGALVFTVAATWPFRVTHGVAAPVLQQTGRFGKELVPTGATRLVDKTETCVPMRSVIAVGGNDDPAVCHPEDARRLATARTGLLVAAAGAALVALIIATTVLGDRRKRATRRAPLRRSTPAPR